MKSETVERWQYDFDDSTLDDLQFEVQTLREEITELRRQAIEWNERLIAFKESSIEAEREYRRVARTLGELEQKQREAMVWKEKKNRMMSTVQRLAEEERELRAKYDRTSALWETFAPYVKNSMDHIRELKTRFDYPPLYEI